MIPNYELESVYDFISEANEGALDHNLKLFIKRFQSDSFSLFNPCFLLVQALCDNVGLFFSPHLSLYNRSSLKLKGYFQNTWFMNHLKSKIIVRTHLF